MATRKSINIQVQLSGKENVRKQIEEIFTYAKNSKIDIKIGDSLINLNALKKALNEIQNDITNINSKNINIVGNNNDGLKQQEQQIEKVIKAKQELINVSNSNSKVNVGQELKSYESLQQRLNEIKGSMSTISNIKMSTNSIGGLDSAIITYKNQLKQTVTETMRWGEVTNQLTGKVEKVFQSTGNLKINDNIEQQLKSADTLKQKYDNLYKSIMNLKNANVLNNGSFNNSKNNGLLDNFKKIDLSNIEQATKQIKKLEDQLATGNTNANKTTSLKSLIDGFKTQKKDLESIEVFKNVDISKVNQLNDSLKQADSLYKRLRSNSPTIASGEYSKVTTNLKDSFKSLDGEVSKLKSADTLKQKYDNLYKSIMNLKNANVLNNGSFNNSKNNGLLDNFKKIDLSNVEQATKQIKRLQDQLSTGNTNASKTTSLKSLIDSLKTQKKDLETLEVFKNVDVSKVNQLNDSLKQADSLYKRLRNNSSTIASGEYSKVATNLKDSFKSVASEVSKLKSADTELNKIKSDIDSLQTKLSTMKTNKIIDESVITKAETQLNSLKNNLNNITTAKAREQFVSMNNEIGKLDKSQNQINRIGKSIETLENSLSGLKGKYGSLVGNTSSVGELKSFEKELNNLKNLKSQLQNGKIIDGNLLTSDINKATNASRNLANSVKQSSSALKLAQQDSISFGDSLKRAFSNAGIYMSTYQIIQLTFRTIKDGISTVISMDTALANLNKVVDLSKNQLLNMRDSAISLGKELGQSATSVASAMAEFGRLYKNTNDIKTMTKVSVLGSNVMDNTTSAQVAKSLTTIMTAMKKEVGDSMTILDSMNEIKCVSPYIVMCK